ncbi:MAG: hypothetical protein ACRD4D_03275 [Candidatus Acidiferrales bacterium]
MKKTLWILVAMVALALSLPAAAQGQGKDKPKGKPAAQEKGAQKPDEAKGKGKEKAEEKSSEKADEAKAKPKTKKEIEAEREHERRAAQGRAFGKDHEKSIRDFFGSQQNLQGLPPGLAKREELPPGLQRHLERNGTLPPGLQKRLQPLPSSLEIKLPKTPDGVKRGIVNGNVVVVEERTSKILDIIKDVTFGGGGQEQSSTGVRRTKQ